MEPGVGLHDSCGALSNSGCSVRCSDFVVKSETAPSRSRGPSEEALVGQSALMLRGKVVPWLKQNKQKITLGVL